MKINIKEILEMQSELDNNIRAKHNLKEEDIFEEKKLALIVELCEMINVNKCFKFWSVNRTYDKNKLGDEFVDCLHFILSISLKFNIKKYEYNIEEKVFTDKELTIKTLELLDIANNINSEMDCISFIEKLFGLSTTFGFSANDIIEFYINKNKVNFQRQKDNY